MIVRQLFYIFMCLLITGASLAFSMDSKNQISQLLKQELSKLYPNAKISLLGPVEWTVGVAPENTNKVSILSDDLKSTVYFSTGGQTKATYAEGHVRFSAMVPGWVAAKRIFPYQHLNPGLFIKNDVDISTGQARELRGIIFSEDRNLAEMESIQTIVEGQFLTATAIRNIPDVMKGDSVRIRLKSDSLTLMTLGIAEETAYINHQIRVMTLKSKRELFGRLQPGGIVEVTL